MSYIVYSPFTMTICNGLKIRLIQMGLTRERVAVALGIDPSLLGRYLRGIRPMPEGMEPRIHAALDLLEEEQRVAAEAVEKLRAERAVLDAGGKRL